MLYLLPHLPSNSYSFHLLAEAPSILRRLRNGSMKWDAGAKRKSGVRHSPQAPFAKTPLAYTISKHSLQIFALRSSFLVAEKGTRIQITELKNYPLVIPMNHV